MPSFHPCHQSGEDQSPGATHRFSECCPSHRHEYDFEQHRRPAGQHFAERGKMREWITMPLIEAHAANPAMISRFHTRHQAHGVADARPYTKCERRSGQTPLPACGPPPHFVGRAGRGARGLSCRASLRNGIGRDWIMLKSFTFWLTVLAVLIAYLCVSVGLRWRREAAERRYRESHWPGRAFDVSAIAPQIRQVRQDPLAVLRARGHPNSCRTRLLAAARRIIAALPFFGRERSELKSKSSLC